MTIEMRDIKKSFGENEVLKGISFSVQGGKALGLLGRNGAGKTTAIRIIMGVFPQDSGSVLLDGAPINRSKLKIGYLPEERGLYPKKIIIEQLIYFGVLKGLTKTKAGKSAQRWLARLEMQEYSKSRLDTLSKGNQQKIQLAATLISDPDIIILDEPFSGLDPVNAMMLKDIVKELISEGKTVLFSSHQMNYVEEFCDKIAILNGGNIVLNGNIGEIKRRYDRSTLFISSPQSDEMHKYLNSLGGQVEGCEKENGGLLVKLKSAADKPELLAALLAPGFDIDEIKVKEPTLNEIFVEYTSEYAPERRVKANEAIF